MKAKCLITKNGYLVSIDGVFFFTTKDFRYRPRQAGEIVTYGSLPPQNEYSHLRDIVKLVERDLTKDEYALALRERQKLQNDKRYQFKEPFESNKHQKVASSVVTLGSFPGFVELRKKFA